MTSKHTPGPWWVNGAQSVRGAQGEYIAKTNWNNGPANARLIAAAPELLEELMRARRVLVSEGYIPAATMDAAIAKARGETC